ncbi:hypothetical protein EBI_26081 [Enterocytozoon bieneusi H348]|nr:hypothetical protein EBI_25502 [Enterocytozoon bieneusi H348]EED44182.1 hypothetical protein EBI_26081 [Enterocytozoon bieneusi H348]|eukprot:XP_002649869.1 hypothetical protein EBI_26081 [Enterocytozoon bieneusi H348]
MPCVFFSLFKCIECLFEVLEPKRGNKISNYIVTASNTVQFFTANIFGLNDSGEWVKIRDTEIDVKLEIYNEGKLMFLDKKPAVDPNFFYTTPVSGKYYIIFSIEGSNLKQYKKLGIEGNTFSGEESIPIIVSNGDVELHKATNFIKRVLEYAKKNLALQNMDFDEEKKYKGIYDGILTTAVILIALKLLATVFTLFYSNWKIKQFFVSQNISANQ